MPAQNAESRLKAVETSLKALQRRVDELEARSTPSDNPIRRRGSKATLTDEEWLAQRKKLAARAREARWPKKTASRKGRA